MATRKQGLTARAFAKAEGCSHTLVNDAVRDGFLRLFDDGSIDPTQVGSGWRRSNRDAGGVGTLDPVSTLPTAARRARPKRISASAAADIRRRIEAGDVVSVAEAEAAKQSALARRQIANARREAGELIEIEIAEGVLFDTFRTYRDSWLNWPVRVAPQIAAELGIDVDKVVEVLTRTVYEHLAELGEPEIVEALTE